MGIEYNLPQGFMVLENDNGFFLFSQNEEMAEFFPGVPKEVIEEVAWDIYGLAIWFGINIKERVKIGDSSKIF